MCLKFRLTLIKVYSTYLCYSFVLVIANVLGAFKRSQILGMQKELLWSRCAAGERDGVDLKRVVWFSLLCLLFWQSDAAAECEEIVLAYFSSNNNTVKPVYLTLIIQYKSSLHNSMWSSER